MQSEVGAHTLNSIRDRPSNIYFHIKVVDLLTARFRVWLPAAELHSYAGRLAHSNVVHTVKNVTVY